MSNGYKAALQRFEDAVRAVALAGPYHTRAEREAIATEYQDAKRHIIQKLSYRALAAEQRADGRDWASGIDKRETADG